MGRSWKSFFARETHEEVKARMAELGYTGAWDEADCLHLTSPLLPAIRVTKDHTEVFFNQMIAQHLANAQASSVTQRKAAEEDGRRSVKCGGSGTVQKEGAVTTRLEDCMRFGDGSAVDGVRTGLRQRGQRGPRGGVDVAERRHRTHRQHAHDARKEGVRGTQTSVRLTGAVRRADRRASMEKHSWRTVELWGVGEQPSDARGKPIGAMWGKCVVLCCAVHVLCCCECVSVALLMR